MHEEDLWTTAPQKAKPNWFRRLGYWGPLIGFVPAAIIWTIMGNLGMDPQLGFNGVIVLAFAGTVCIALDSRRREQQMLQAMLVAGFVLVIGLGVLYVDYLSVPK